MATAGCQTSFGHTDPDQGVVNHRRNVAVTCSKKTDMLGLSEALWKHTVQHLQKGRVTGSSKEVWELYGLFWPDIYN
jgi:hypothetical protein